MKRRSVSPQKERTVYSGLSGKSGEKTFTDDKVRKRKRGRMGKKYILNSLLYLSSSEIMLLVSLFIAYY